MLKLPLLFQIFILLIAFSVFLLVTPFFFQTSKSDNSLSLIIINDEKWRHSEASVKMILSEIPRDTEIIVVGFTNSELQKFRWKCQDKLINSATTISEALGNAKGKFVSLLQSSNKLSKNYFKEMIPKLQTDSSLLVCSHEYVRCRHSFRVFQKKEHFTSALLFDNPFSFGCMFQRVFQRKHKITFHDDFGDEKFYDFWAQFVLKGATIAFLPKPLVTLQRLDQSTQFHYSPPNPTRDEIARTIQSSLDVVDSNKCAVLKKVLSKWFVPSWLKDAKEYWKRYCSWQEETKHPESVISIAMASNDYYVIPTVTAITSLMENSNRTTHYNIYLLHGPGLREIGKERLSYVEKKYRNCRLIFIDMKDEYIDAQTTAWIPMESYYRLLLPNLIPNVDRIIWLDGDVLVLKDLTEMYSIDMNGYFLKGQLDTFPHLADRYGVYNDHYICAGVLLMNLKEMRKDHLQEQYMNFISNNKNNLLQHDQTVINVVGYKKTGILPAKYGIFNSITELKYIKEFIKTLRSPEKYTVSDYVRGIETPTIAHLVLKPWKKKEKYFSLWWEYAKRTEFYEEACSIWGVNDCK